MKQNILISVLAVAAIAFAGLWIAKDKGGDPAPEAKAFDTSGTLEALERDLQKMKAKNAELEIEMASMRRDKSDGAAEPLSVTAEASAGDSELDDLFGEGVDESASSSRDAEIGKALTTFIGNLSNMFSEGENGEPNEMSKVWRDSMQIENRRRVAREYGDLLSRFDLTLEDRERFIDLLASRGGGGGGWGRWGRGGRGNEEKRQQAESEIESFLGDEGYAAYRDFEDTKYARGRVGDFEKELGNGLAMSEEQRDSMVGMFGDMEEFGNNFRREAWNQEGSTEERQAAMDARLDELEQRYNKMVNDASEVLDAQQVEALATHLDTNLQRVEKQVEMGQMWRRQMEDAGGGELMKMFEGIGRQGR